MSDVPYNMPTQWLYIHVLLIKYVEKVNKRLNNLCVLIGPPRGEIIYRHNKERFRFKREIEG